MISSGDSGSNDLFENKQLEHEFRTAVESLVGSAYSGVAMPGDQVISLVIDSLNLCFSEISLPLPSRQFVTALIGVSGGTNDWFVCSDYQLAGRLFYGERDRISVDSMKKRIQRLRERELLWQIKTGHQIIETRSGTASYRRDDAGEKMLRMGGSKIIDYEPSQYKLLIFAKLKTLDELIARSASTPYQQADFLAKKFISLIRVLPQNPPQKTSLNPEMKIARLRKSVLSLACTLAGLRREQGGSVKQLIDELVKDIQDNAVNKTDHQWKN